MNHQQKAKDLVEKFTDDGIRNWSAAKQCALICVDQIIENTTNCMECGGATWTTEDLEKIKAEIKKV